MLNGGFEKINPNNFNPLDPYLKHWGPSHWVIFLSPCFIVPQTGVISTDSHSGEYCIKMETLDCAEPGRREPWVYFINNPGAGSPDFYSNPYLKRPEFFSFYYKFISQGEDSARVLFDLFTYDSITLGLNSLERTDTVGYVERYVNETVAE